MCQYSHMELEIRALRLADQEAIVRLLVDAMLDNPNHVQAFGGDAEARARSLRLTFNAVSGQQLGRGVVLGVFDSAALAGVAGMMPPGACPSTLASKAAALATLVMGGGLQNSRRVLEWLDTWKDHDPGKPHWHLGPMAVAPRHQGKGLGSALLAACCEHIDEQGGAAYLENDRRENLGFFRSAGFEVMAEAEVLGAANWFMWRSSARW